MAIGAGVSNLCIVFSSSWSVTVVDVTGMDMVCAPLNLFLGFGSGVVDAVAVAVTARGVRTSVRVCGGG
ncbi:hypothetical protein GCM10009610_30120 [Pseudonocardia xinjiangensis]